MKVVCSYLGVIFTETRCYLCVHAWRSIYSLYQFVLGLVYNVFAQ